MTYIDKNNEKKHPLIWHRVSIGSYEKTLAMLLEKYDGAMPTWLSPTQVKVLTISEKYINYANAIVGKLKKQQIRIEKDFSNEKLSYKVRKAQFEKIPYIMIVGGKEQKNGTVSVKSRSKLEEGNKKLDEIIERILYDIKTRSLESVAILNCNKT